MEAGLAVRHCLMSSRLFSCSFFLSEGVSGYYNLSSVLLTERAFENKNPEGVPAVSAEFQVA